jgi:hypothetical protein
MKKTILFLIFAILLTISVYGIIPECQRTMQISDLPCYVISSYNNSGNCDINSSIKLMNNIIVQNITWANYSPNCFFTFNIKTPEVYQYGGIETGVITIEGNNNMIALILVYLLLITYFAVIGMLIKNVQIKFLAFALSILEILMMCGTVYASEAGLDYLRMLQINFISVLILGFALGMIAFFAKATKTISDEDIIPLDDKFEEDKW